MVSFTLDLELIERLEAWLKSQAIPPSKTAVMEASLRGFLDSKERKK
jgi:hypothetical protein